MQFIQGEDLVKNVDGVFLGDVQALIAGEATSDNAFFPGSDKCCLPAVGVKLFINIFDVGVYRVNADVEV